MTYDPKTWTKGDTVHDTDLNRIETGISDVSTQLAGVYTKTEADGKFIEQPSGDVTLTGTHSAITSSSVRVKEITPGVIMVNGYVDVDSDIGGGFIDTGMVIPAGMRPGDTTYLVSNFYNSSYQYRYKIGTDGVIQYQQSGVDNTFASINAVWVAA